MFQSLMLQHFTKAYAIFRKEVLERVNVDKLKFKLKQQTCKNLLFRR